MKSYTITVNGNVYDVTVEETGAAAPAAAPRKAAPAAAPAAAAAPQQVQEALRLKQVQQEKYSSWKQILVQPLREAIPS